MDMTMLLGEGKLYRRKLIQEVLYKIMEEVVLYGGGVAGEKFYCMYRNRFKIKYVIDKVCNRLFHEIPVCSFESKREEIKREFVVVATESISVYREISDVLQQNGMDEFKNYLWMYSLDKKLTILYGNCHLLILKQYLSNNFEFSRKYHIEHYYIADSKENWRYPKNSVLKYADIIISQDIRTDNAHGVPGVEDIFLQASATCIKIKIPNLYGFNFFFPQMTATRNDIVNKHVNEKAIVDEKLKRAATVITGWGDKNIEAMHEKGYEIEEIVNAIKNDDIYLPKEIIENFEKEINRLQQREVGCDIKISDYILENYKNKQLFYDYIHPANNIIFEKGRRILNLLGITPAETVCMRDALDENELFIYGCVKRALGIKYEQEYIRHHNIQGTLYNRAIDLKEYVESYIAWYYTD